MSELPDRPYEGMTKDEAIALVDTQWWDKLAPEEVFRVQAKSLLSMPFSEFHRIAEKALDRPVWKHEFADPDALLAELDGETPTPEDPNQHAMDSMASLLLSQGKDPDETMIVVRADRQEGEDEKGE